MNIIQQIKTAGIVGAGGAGFPTYYKLETAKQKVDTYIINAAECEPLIQVDKQILKIYPQKILASCIEIGNLLGVKKIVIAIKEKYHDTIEILQQVLPKFDHKIEICYLENFYPAGDEFSLVYEVTGRIVPEGGLPLEVGVVVNNVVTLLNIYNALYENLPVITRAVSVIGEVYHPKTLVVPVGTQIKNLLEFCGGTKISSYTVIDGGPMMGKIVSLDDVVTKRTSAILVLPDEHPIVRMKSLPEKFFLYQTKSACEQCRDCTEICPRYLLGHDFECHKIQRSVSYQTDELLTEAYLCCECGLCDWVCPMNLLPRRVNQKVKQMLIQKNIKNPHHRKPFKVRSLKEYRKVPPERIISRFELQQYVSSATLEPDTKEVPEVKIPLLQHIGVPAVPTIKVGDKVKKGDLIGDIPEGKLGSPVHSSIDGEVVQVTKEYIKIKR